MIIINYNWSGLLLFIYTANNNNNNTNNNIMDVGGRMRMFMLIMYKDSCKEFSESVNYIIIARPCVWLVVSRNHPDPYR